MRLFQVFVYIFSLALIGFACGSGTTTDSEASSNQMASVSAPPADGAAIYRQYCVLCHGANGKLGLNGAGDLTKSKLSLKERITQITKGKNMMQPYEELLTKEEIKAVAKYTLSLK